MKSLLLLLAFTLIVPMAQAADSDIRFGAGAGVFDAFDDMDTGVGSLTIESKPLPKYWGLRPTVQFMAIEGSGLYLGVGVLKEIFINTDWTWGLGFSAGLAHDSEKISAIDHDLEFYSRVILSRQINASSAVRLELGHISNGGLDDKNPGTETLMLFWLHSF